jgi:hypothetical protein
VIAANQRRLSRAVTVGLSSMTRAGRKRKAGARYRGGQLKRQPKPQQLEERVRVARALPHRRGLKSNDRMSEFAESSLGRLSLMGLVSRGERAAGEAFAGIVGRYRGVIGGPRQVRSLSLPTWDDPGTAPDDEDVTPRFECSSQHADPIERRISIAGTAMTIREWPCQQPGEVCMCAERRDRYMRVYEAIAQAGRAALMAVIRVAVRGEEPRVAELVYLKRGLSAAQRYLGLTDVDS